MGKSKRLGERHTMALKIEIPLEEGWTCKSPVDLPVRERLEASRGVKSPKSPEDLLKARRATSYELIVARGADLSAKCVRASAAREKFLLGRSSKAHFGTIPRRTPAKLTKDGGVLLTSPPTTPPVTDPQAENSLAMMKYGFRLWYSLSKARPAAAAADEPAPDEDEWQVVDAAP